MPGSGVPTSWRMADGYAKHRALDHFRRSKLLERKHEELAAITPSRNPPGKF